MKNGFKIFFTLLKGEFLRLCRYKILITGIAVSLLWVGISALVSKAEALSFIPLFILSDTAMMSVLLLSAMMYFEKQEGTLKTTFITPVTPGKVVGAKLAASAVCGMLSAAMVSVAAVLIHRADIQILPLLFYSAITVTANCSLGFLFVYYGKDFNSMLINYFLFILVFFIPPVLLTLGIIPESAGNFLFVSPFYASQVLIESAFKQAEAYKILISAAYLIAVSAVLIPLYVTRKIREFSIGG